MKAPSLHLAVAALLFCSATTPLVAHAQDLDTTGNTAETAPVSELLSTTSAPESAAAQTSEERAEATEPSKLFANQGSPLLFAVDAETGLPIDGVRINASIIDPETLWVSQLSKLVPIPKSGLNFSDLPLVMNTYPRGVDSEGNSTDRYQVVTASVPAGYLPSNAGGELTGATEGWQATGDLQQVGPNTFVLKYTKSSDGSSVIQGKQVGTEEDPLVTGPGGFALPRMVTVDRQTGEVVDGFFWDWQWYEEPYEEDPLGTYSYENSDYYGPLAFSLTEIYSPRNNVYDIVRNPYRAYQIKFNNIQAPSRCKLVDEEVVWQWNWEDLLDRSKSRLPGTHKAWGAGIFKYYENPEEFYTGGPIFNADEKLSYSNALIYGIPVDCDPTPVCNPQEFQQPLAVSPYNDPAALETELKMQVLRLVPRLFVLGRENSSGLVGSGWISQVYARDKDSGQWRLLSGDTSSDSGWAQTTADAQGLWYEKDVALDAFASEYYVVARQERAPLGYVPTNQTYVFHGVMPEGVASADWRWNWTATEGTTVNFNAEEGTIDVDHSTDVTDPAEQTLVKYGTWAFAVINPTVGGEECQVVPEPSTEETGETEETEATGETGETGPSVQPSTAPIPWPINFPWPIDIPSVKQTQTPASPPSTQPASAPTQAPATSAERGILANTGANAITLGLLASMMLTAGGVLLLKRRSGSHT